MAFQVLIRHIFFYSTWLIFISSGYTHEHHSRLQLMSCHKPTGGKGHKVEPQVREGSQG